MRSSLDRLFTALAVLLSLAATSLRDAPASSSWRRRVSSSALHGRFSFRIRGPKSEVVPSSIPYQLPPAYVRGFGIGDPLRVSVEGALDTHLRKQHWSAVFSSINQHLDCQPVQAADRICSLCRCTSQKAPPERAGCVLCGPLSSPRDIAPAAPPYGGAGLFTRGVSIITVFWRAVRFYRPTRCEIAGRPWD
jgi:hypothetical protein